MFFQVLDNKKECYKIYHDKSLVDLQDVESELSHTWAPTDNFLKKDIEYAQIWCQGKKISEVCPEHLKERWTHVNKSARAFLKSFENAKIDMNDVCFYDLVPNKFLMEFYDTKNEICRWVFENYKKPSNYEFLCDLTLFLKRVEQKNINLDFSNLSLLSHKSGISKINKQNRKIAYNPWGTVTGRLTTKKDSFPILTLNKHLRTCIKPQNDVFIEFDFNSAELRVLLSLLGETQPKQDMHSWLNEKVFSGKLDRAKTKKKVFAWLYNPKARNKKLNSYLNRDKILSRYFINGAVNTPYGREIKTEEEKAVNYLIQSTTSDMLLNSALKVDKLLEYKKSFVCFCIHDSIVVDMSYEDKNLIEDLTTAFSETQLGSFKANLSIGKDFGTMRKVK